MFQPWSRFCKEGLTRIPAFIIATIFIIGIIGGWSARTIEGFTPPYHESSLRAGGEYKLVNPLLTCGYTDWSVNKEYKDLSSKIESVISKEREKDPHVEASVYFRDLDHGYSVSVDGAEAFAPASLLKVPIMLAYLKKVDDGNATLSWKYTYNGATDLNSGQYFRSPNWIRPGAYSADDLLKAMIAFSDNNATKILMDSVGSDSIDSLYRELEIETTSADSAAADFLTPESYSYFFRVLYNATYLNRELSEKALEFLAEPDFPEGISAGVPSNIIVANKFGERTVELPGNVIESRELHDCGIIYYPGRPYFLCVMTKGAHFDELTEMMQGISATAYRMVDATMKKI